MKRVYLGLDLGSTQFEISAMDREGKVLNRSKYKTTELNLRSAMSQLSAEHKCELHVHIEACELAGWTREVLSPMVTRVVVSNPRENAWIAKDQNKSDSIDSYKLAELLRLNRYKEVYYDDAKELTVFKQVVQHYENMTHSQAKQKVKIKSRLRMQGVIRKDQSLYSKQGRKEVLDQIKNKEIKAIINQQYELLDATRKQQKEALRTMSKMSKEFSEISLLKTVPGIKTINACRFFGYIQNPHRFSNTRKLWRYARLGVVQQSSNGKPIGPPHIDRAGCGTIKDVANNAVKAALRRKDNNIFKRTYEQALAHNISTIHARLTTERKVLSVMRAVCISGKPYCDDLG